ncbi:hypothetical protein K1T71_013289 [Dendrolimus kikuchii]|uniref:Uncharacterized protein n=1 Tax=Dendrolimus kikuchii TaxID=765133 RepID=A0ACC1CHN6_9NEOP|nr:hypothetical protein K1T71_013289 [Dendrolimus kikuchii]
MLFLPYPTLASIRERRYQHRVVLVGLMIRQINHLTKYQFDISAFNTNAILYDNAPWRPGREIDVDKAATEEDQRKLKNLATRIMSNGVEVLVKDKNPDGKQEQTKHMDVKTIQPSSPTNVHVSSFQKLDKRIDDAEENHHNFDIIQPSETSNIPCTSSCSCSHTKTESLKTKYTEASDKMTNKEVTKLDVRPTNKETLDKKTQYPYEFEASSQAPTDRIVEKYTEVINDYSDEKNSNSVEESDLLTNEQAPGPLKTNKISNTKNPDKTKPQKPNKNRFVVADLLKLGSLGIKGLSQLAPVFEKMTDSFIKRQDTNANKTVTTVKPSVKLTSYNVNKRLDSDLESKHNNFPIYIPVDEMETSESQNIFTNATLHQNLAWAAEHKHSKAHSVPNKIIHESPLVNGGIPISPGEIITANSDVIVGKPAVGGPLTLAASGIKLHNPVNPPPIDSFVSANEQYRINDKPFSEQSLLDTKVDDSFDLKPPELPKLKPKINRPLNLQRPSIPTYNYQNKMPLRKPSTPYVANEYVMKTEHVKTTNPILGNHGRPVFLDYIPSLAKPAPNLLTKQPVDNARPANDGEKNIEVTDNSPSSSEVVNMRITTDDKFTENRDTNKPFLVDIQPSRVANVLIPHGSSTALVFAGSSEPHKTGEYIDDPLPYPEPGYFGSFSIDAPQMTNVLNVTPNNNNQFFIKPNNNSPLESYKPNTSSFNEQGIRSEFKLKWKESKRQDFNKIPPPTSNQETQMQVGPQIMSYNPNIYNPTNSGLDKYGKGKDRINSKDIIDKEYENFLAVPPPPPKMKYNQDKPFNQRPIVHTKPVQDMKVFLNVNHPVPKEQKLPKVTSEIYFAAQAPDRKPAPTFTIHMPNSAQKNYIQTFNNVQNTNSQVSNTNQNQETAQNAFTVIPSPNVSNKSVIPNNHPNNIYSVTLNTATNVASVGDSGQVIGSSMIVPVNSNTGQLNANIPISTNFAIRVEENQEPIETINQHSNRKPIVNNEHIRVPNEFSLSDNKWNKSTNFNKIETTIFGNNYFNVYPEKNVIKEHVNLPIPPSLNSHANFPMINDYSTPTILFDNIKPVSEHVDDEKETKRPAKYIPNIPANTNSHGWYSSILFNDNNISNIKVEATTRKIIPLLQEFGEKVNVPQFDNKVTSIGKPPNFWTQTPHVITSMSVGKPFTKPQSSQTPIPVPVLTTKTYNKYIPSIFSVMKQPAYDIPIRDNSDETTTSKNLNTHSERPKPLYENSEEIYDGEEELDNIDNDGEVSQESMKIPVVSASNESEEISKPSSEILLLQDEVFKPSKDKSNNFSVSNTGSQTEKPFINNNKTTFQSNTIKPIYANNHYNMKPRPFTALVPTVLDHQLQQPHWQINQLMENATNVSSYEENLDLNIGEEIKSPSTNKSVSIEKNSYENDIKRKKLSAQFTFERTNATQVVNDSNIITSTVHIKDKKPLIVEKSTEKSNLPSFTITTEFDNNRTSSEIIDLSPPPPTLDYNFKPSTVDEMIMGMSPPPPRTPPAVRPPLRGHLTPRPIPIRTPPSYRTKPPRTTPPRVSTQRPTRKPMNRDEISTYRPAFDLINNIRRPTFNRDQPSSQLLPPPRETVTRIATPINELPAPTATTLLTPDFVFPTPVSTGWLTSSGIEFSSSFNFAPNSIKFPETLKTSVMPETHVSSSENSFSYENGYSSENSYELSSNQSDEETEENITKSKEVSSESNIKHTTTSTQTSVGDSIADESSKEDETTERIRFPFLGHKNRTRKPFPTRHDDKKNNSSKLKLPSKPTSTIRPTRTLSRQEQLYPTRHTTIKKVIRPATRTPSIISNVIESSETSIDEDILKPTESLNENIIRTSKFEILTSSKKELFKATPIYDDYNSIIPTHHAGNEIKISDEIVPTKTEFRTTVVTLTKTLSEPPKTISSIGYINLTHTLTVTHTKTSLISQSEGAHTQTLVLTNTHTSTIVDVVTEIHTQVQPTTIIETVTKHVPIVQVEPTPVQITPEKTKLPLDDISMSSEEKDNLVIKDIETTENVQKIDTENEGDNDSFFVVMKKSQNGGQSPPVNTDVETGDYDITRNEQVNSDGVSQVLFGEILLAGAPYLETSVGNNGPVFGKECQPDCKASRNERCQRIDGIMKCVCRPGFARMFPDRPCKPTYTYSVKLALDTQGNESLYYQEDLANNSSKQYQTLAVATHEGINRMIMQSDLRDVYHGVHITGFRPIDMKKPNGDPYHGVMNEFYVQLSDNAHESRLKEVIEKYLRNNNYSLGGTDVHAAGDLVDRLEVNDFDECTSGQFHDCSEHAQCFNLRGTYTCSCVEGFSDLSVNILYPGRICSAEPVGCERCNYHGACYSRDDKRVLCECFQWYTGSTCNVNLKVVLIALVVCGALLTAILAACAVISCRRTRPPQRSIVACIQSMPALHQGAIPKQRTDRRALINERGESGDASSVQNASLPYMPAKYYCLQRPSTGAKKCAISDPPAHDPPPPPAPAVMIPRARLNPHHGDSRENVSRKRSLELSSEAKLISYLESGAVKTSEEMRRKHSMESSYSVNKDKINKQGALVSAGFKVSTTVRPEDTRKEDRDDESSINKGDHDTDMSRFNSLRKSYRTLSEARSIGGTLPASTGRAASSTRLTHQENTMAERDLGSTFLLPHVHLYKPDITSDVSEFDSL